jgi:small-conductance mechanosensitive channel
MSFNPLLDNLSDLTESQLTEKISDLTRRYYQTRNPQAQQQIITFLDMFRQEQQSRAEKQRQEQKQNDSDSDLDNLININ